MIEPGSLSPVSDTITLVYPASQVFQATTLEPSGGPPTGIHWTVDGTTVMTQTETFTYTPALADAGRDVQIGLTVIDKTPLVHPDMSGGALRHSHTWTVQVEMPALAGVTIDGPTTGLVGQPQVFTATVTPEQEPGQVTYSWSPPPGAGQGTPQAIYTWSTAGVRTLTVTATHTTGAVVSDTHQIDIWLDGCWVFLPLVFQQEVP
jgi:hypothetical protein